MNVEPIINAKFKRFREKMELVNMADGVAFEQFVNHTILSAHQPDAFNGDNELFEKVNVGGTKDMGIDGIAIKLNGLFIRDIDEAKDLTKKLPRLSIEFIFIQSKYKSNLKKYANKVLSQNKMTKNAVNPSRVETMFENFFNKLVVSF